MRLHYSKAVASKKGKREVMKEDSKARFSDEWEKSGPGRATKAVLWRTYEELKRMKVEANKLMLRNVSTKWEKEYETLLEDTWERGYPKGGSRSKHVIYT